MKNIRESFHVMCANIIDCIIIVYGYMKESV